MNLDFSYYLPTRILFGAGRLKELSTTRHIPGKKALVVIGSKGAMRKNGYLGTVTGYLKENGVDSMVYEKILPNPVSRHVDEGAEVARKHGCDFVVGLGGGSTIDSAKSIAVMAKNRGVYWDYVTGGSGGGKTPSDGALPIVAIPTTAGTGTEADPWTVITKTDTKEKIGWGVDATFPALSIVDPELMTSVPPDTTAHSGMDAFFHAVEAYVSVCNQPASDRLALEAVSLITKNLPLAVKDGRDMDARKMLAWASTEAGICESISSCISHHSIEHAISAYYPDVPHGAGLTMISIAYFSYLIERNPGRFPDIARAMGEDVEKLPKKERPYAFINALKKLIKKTGLNVEKLSVYGIKKTDLRTLAENSFYAMGGLYDVTPVRLTLYDVVKILENAYE